MAKIQTVTSRNAAANVPVAKAADEPKAETPNEKFVRLASSRVTEAINRIKLVGNLGSDNYDRTPEQIAKIVKALRDEVDTCEADLTKGRKVTKAGFTL